MVDAPHAAPASAAPNRTGNDHEPSAPAGALPRGPRDGVGAVPAGPLSGPLGAAHGPVPALAAPDFASIKLINTNDGAPSPTDTVCGADSDDAFNKPTGKFVPELLRRTAPISEVLEQRLQAVQAGDSDDDSHEDAFFAGDLGEVVRQYAKFRRLLPRVVPHYAVKCNPDDLIVKTLVELGASFDCASKVRGTGHRQTCRKLTRRFLFLFTGRN